MLMNTNLPVKRKIRQEDFWIGLSDLMTSLMMIFLLISVIYMIKVQAMVKIPTIYKETLQGLGLALQKEFKNDLPKWKATIDNDLTVRFQKPEMMFDTNSAELKPHFKAILDDFFPRYMLIMSDPKYINNIEEIRIEGHTSTVWKVGTTQQNAYFKNMELSQARTRSTLEYIMTTPIVSSTPASFNWLKQHVRAIGFSSAMPLDHAGKLVISAEQLEDPVRSQRVEFRVRTTVEKQISDIVENQK